MLVVSNILFWLRLKYAFFEDLFMTVNKVLNLSVLITQ